jgi:hypothetical protein
MSPDTTRTFVAGDDIGKTAALVHAIGGDDRHEGRTVPLDDAAGLLGSDNWDLVVIVLSLDAPSAEAAGDLARKADAAASAPMVTSYSHRRLVFCHLVDKRDSDDPDLFWLPDYVRGRCLFAVESGVDHGVGVTLLRVLVSDPTQTPWVRDVADAVVFLDSLAPSVIVPELELAR